MGCRCRCGAILQPGQLRCKDCSLVILAMIKTDRLAKPLVIDADTTRRIKWGPSFYDVRDRLRVAGCVAAIILIAALVVTVSVWAVLSQ